MRQEKKKVKRKDAQKEKQVIEKTKQEESDSKPETENVKP